MGVLREVPIVKLKKKSVLKGLLKGVSSLTKSYSIPNDPPSKEV